MISIVIPAYNEESHIGQVISELPAFLDKIILINDGSSDRTVNEMKKAIIGKEGEGVKISEIEVLDDETRLNLNRKYYIIHHKRNMGKGAGIKTGYKYALQLGSKCIVTIDGDGQMDAREITDICQPLLLGHADYVKGNRLQHPRAKFIIPKIRLIGIYILTVMTRLCSGYKHINDAQTGFTAISSDALSKLKIEEIYDYYGYVNDIIVSLSMINAKIVEVPITPIYQDSSESKMRLRTSAPKLFFLMIRLFVRKLKFKLKSAD